MKKILSMLLIFAATLTFGMLVSSCSDDDDDSPSMSFDSQTIVGTWEITDVEGTNFPMFKKGNTFTFNSDGTCDFHDYEQTAYRIDKGRIFTYYAETGEPMYIYTLTATSGNTLTVNVNGTLDEINQSINIKMQKVQ